MFNIENATGTNFADTVIGSGRNNILRGESGNDVLDGVGGNDRLFGGKGGDDLFGGSGRDTLNGGTGYDFLEGNAGADFFDFNARTESVVGARRDVITDFSRAEGDRIDLRGIDANYNAGGNQVFDFIGRAAFSGDAGELRYSGHIISADMDGDRVADFQLDVNLTRYVASDFLL